MDINNFSEPATYDWSAKSGKNLKCYKVKEFLRTKFIFRKKKHVVPKFES